MADLIPAGDPPADPNAQTPPDPKQNSGDPPASSGTERPEWLPEEFWGDNGFNQDALEALKSRPEPQADVPASAEAYKLPEIEGFDAEKAGASPLFAALRKNAHANGMGQAAFEATIKDYVEGESARAEEYEAEQKKLLGSNADQRLKALGTWLDSSLPPEKANALRAMATNADAVAGLEELMNSKAKIPPRGDPPAPKPAKTKDEIRKLMQSDAYRGTPEQRDPAVVKEVEAFFAAEAAAKTKA